MPTGPPKPAARRHARWSANRPTRRWPRDVSVISMTLSQETISRSLLIFRPYRRRQIGPFSLLRG